MTYKKFEEEFLAKGLIKRQRPDLETAEKLILRSYKDLKTAKANLIIDEGIAYTVAYLAMLHSGRAFMLLKVSGLLTVISTRPLWNLCRIS